MKKLFFLFLCIGLSSSAFGQFNAILLNFTPLTHRCDGSGGPISHGYLGYVWWDQNDNGPDSSDIQPIVGNGFGECNFNQIDMGTGEDLLGIPGGFATDPAFTISTNTPQPSRYFVTVVGTNAIWTSAVFTIADGLSEYEIGGWTCEELVNICDEPTYIYNETVGGIDYWANGPHYSCLSFCANTPVQVCYGPLGPDAIPYAVVYFGCNHGFDGCNTECMPAAFTFSNDDWTYDETNSLWCNWIYPGDTDGCVCLKDSFSVEPPPCDEPTYIYYETIGGIDYWANGPHYSCVSVCANEPVQFCYGPLGQDVIPYALVRSGCSLGHEGCNTACPPASFTFNNSSWTYDEANSLWCNWIYSGDADGCVCLEDSFSVPTPPCDEPTYIYHETVGGIDYWANGPHFSCVPLCANAPVQICYGPLGQDVVPYAAVRSGCSFGHEGCSTECPPASFTFNNSSWTYDEANSLWCNWIYPGDADGCVCLEDSFSVPTPPCDEPTYYYYETAGGIDYWANGSHFSCVPLCANTPVQICYGPLGQDVVPYAAVRSGCSFGHEGCNTECPPAGFYFNNNAWTYDESNSLWCNWIYPGNTDGCVCVEDSFSVAPPCDEPTYIYFETAGGIDYWANGPHYTCLSLCANTPVQVCYGPLSHNVFVFGELIPGCSYGLDGCSTECPPVNLSFDNDAWTYDELSGFWCNWIHPEFLSGCVCMVDYFDHTIGFVELSFEAQARDNAILIAWATASESGIDYFRLLRDGQLVYSVAGTNRSAGSTYSYLDENVVNGRRYAYSIEAVNFDGTVNTWSSVVEATPSASSAVVAEYALNQNYPNPFNSITNFSFDMVNQNSVTLSIYNVSGELVAQPVNGVFSSGRHTISYDANSLATGLYFYTAKIGNEFASTKKMLLVK